MLSFKQFLLGEGKVHTKFPVHDELNPKIWDGDKLKPEVKKSLMKIAKEFEEFLDSEDVDVMDVTFTGSLANYNYTKYSDIDLHLIVDASSKDNEDCKIDLRNFFNTKKTLWNETHDIDVLGFPVELYAQLADEEVQAKGIYSITNDEWVKVPAKSKEKYDRYAVGVKAKYFTGIIDKIIADKADDPEYLEKIKTKIWDMRKSGLEKGGEWSEENLAFKSLRNSGYIKRLLDYIHSVKTTNLSLIK